jgi:hypothetical protein
MAARRHVSLNAAGAAAGVRPTQGNARTFKEGRSSRSKLAAGRTDRAQSEGIMTENDPRTSFRGLPLTAEQDSEISHYIHVRIRNHLPWDTPELQAMLNDMLDPPESADEDSGALSDSVSAQHRLAQDEEHGDDAVPQHEQHAWHAS